jgi:hypothetical protein
MKSIYSNESNKQYPINKDRKVLIKRINIIFKVFRRYFNSCQFLYIYYEFYLILYISLFLFLFQSPLSNFFAESLSLISFAF